MVKLNKVNAAVLHVNPGNYRAPTPTMTIARVLAETLNIPLVHDEQTIRRAVKDGVEVLFVKPGVLRFVAYRELVYELVGRAEVLVLVDNDALFDVDKRHNPDGDASWWSATPTRTAGQYGEYINWNRAAWKHHAVLPLALMNVPDSDSVVYHGRLRPDRADSFTRYFTAPKFKTVMWVLPKDRKTVEVMFPNIKVHVSKQSDILELGCYYAGLYIEDEFSHVTYTSPAQRFYECLQVGLPILIDSKCLGTFAKAGIKNAAEFAVERPADFVPRMREQTRKLMQKEQHRLWYCNYGEALKSDIRAAAKKHFNWEV